jgi:hypothetical protein
MSDDSAAEANTGPSGEKRERSSIEFPYMGLEEAIEVAKAIHGTTGSGVCQQDQLAAALKLSMASSGFRVRLSTAKLFGLIESDRGSSAYRLTDLGSRVIDPSQERSAKVEAFLKVPLYAKLVELHRGKTLPPASALESVLAQIGVAKKQTDRARQTFERSATSAGFFDFGREKLVTPANLSQPPQSKNGDSAEDRPPPPPPPILNNGTGDPVVDALVKKLPNSGSTWPVDERITWLRMISMSFDLAYGVEQSISIGKSS